MTPQSDANVRVSLDSGITQDATTDILDGGHEVEDTGMFAPCDGQNCGENAFCDEEQNACRCLDGFLGEPPDDCVPVNTPRAWIGSPCANVADCDYENARCQTGQDFSGGHCTLDCTRYCPDREAHPVTFCIETSVEEDGRCYARCDSEIFPSNAGCRRGYECVPWPRYNEPEVVKNVCVPQAWTSQMPCADLANHAGNDDCYLNLISAELSATRNLAIALLEGRGTATVAEAWLDQNFSQSQSFITQELGRTIHENYSAGHRSSTPMRGAIVHYTAASKEDGTIRYFVSSNPHASTHFVIGSLRNGLIVQIFSHRNRTWHAGSSYNHDRFGIDFANAGYLNPRSGGGYEDYAGRIYDLNLPLHATSPVHVTGGIPNADRKYARKEYWQPYTYYQLLSFILIGRALHEVYTLESEAIERHGDVASSRVDPGPQLPLTFLKTLIFNHDNVFDVVWLNEFKQQATWIANHPEAR